MNQFFAPGREFSLIETMFGPDRFRRDARGLGDDAFLFEPQTGSRWVATADASAEGIHYRLDWTTPGKALRKALLANLSDINAMGGRSRHAFLNLGARPDWDEAVFTKLGKTLRNLEEEHDFRVSGGDTIRTKDASFFAFTVLGELRGNPLLRSDCAPGHRIYVSGGLGGSAAGLSLLEREGRPEDSNESALMAVHLDPRPPLELGPILASFRKRIGAIDISDGLSSELWHLSRQSGCRLRIDEGKIPVHPGLRTWNKDEVRDFVFNGGEEYQLLFTGDFSPEELARLRTIASISEIGTVQKGEGVLLMEKGTISPLVPGGFSH